MTDYYSRLGVSRNATQEDLKKAYKKASMQHHPDRGGDAEKFKRINEAYSTLKDPAKKQQYDNPQQQQRNPFGQGQQEHNPFEGTPFEHHFHHGFGQQRPRRPLNQDIRIMANVDLRDIVTGKNLFVQLPLGSGRTESMNVDIPAGAKQGDTIQYEGLGDDTHRQFPRGNLHVVIQVAPVIGWERNGNDLITKKTVNLFDLLLGDVIIVTTLDDRNIKLTIPKGTNSGQRFSIPGYGIPDINTAQRGNIHVIVEAETPEITDENLLNKIKQIREEIE